MHASRLAALLAVAAAVTAAPAPAAEKTTATTRTSTLATAPWVSVGWDGVAHTTVTPAATTVDGTPSVVSAQPTTTPKFSDDDATRTTSQPAATATDGGGTFPQCTGRNSLADDGTPAPFCAPAASSTLYVGTTYYVTWDPSFFNTTNTTVVVRGDRMNPDTGAVLAEAFASEARSASVGFYAWSVSSALLSDAPSKQAGVPVNLSLVYTTTTATSRNTTNSTTTTIDGPRLTVALASSYHQPKAKAPSGPALYIGLPVVLGFVVLLVVGTCLWNRHARRIGIASVMGGKLDKLRSRARHGRRGYGVGQSRRQRVGALHLDSKDAIRLQDHTASPVDRFGTGAGPSGSVRRDAYTDDYTDARPPPLDLNLSSPPGGRPRRDSDALGSLAGTPTDDRFGSHPLPSESTGNAFRDELRRQAR